MRIGPFHFGYAAVEDKQRRAPPKTRVYHEGEVLTDTKRRKVQATAQDQVRNLALVAWMVRKHLDYVAKFHVSFRTGEKDLDTLVNRILRWHGQPRNLDYLGRFGRDEMFRLMEHEKVVCGDAGLLKLPALKVQAIESDLIAKGDGAPDGVNDDGTVVDDTGRIVQWAICERGANGGKAKHAQLVNTESLIFDGYWTRFSSQRRGISPLTTAINTVQDIHEGFEFNLIKAKMHALFGVAIMRGPQTADGDLGGAAGATVETESATATATQEEYDLNPTKINMLDMNAGDDVKVIESGTPSIQFIEGSYLFIQIAMLALDIPVTCFDSRRASFSARIADLNEYEVSCESKRTKNKYVRQEYSNWLLGSIYNTPDSPWRLKETADAAGMSLRDVQESVEWIASGSPWLDKFSQIQGDELGIALALDNPIDAARRRGNDVFANIDKIAEVQAYAKSKGVTLKVASAGDKTTKDVEDDPGQDPAKSRNGDDNE